MMFGRKLLAPLGRMVERDGEMSNTVLGFTLIAFCISAFVMDAVGIHAIFGGFILGTVMPRGLFAAELKKISRIARYVPESLAAHVQKVHGELGGPPWPK